MVIIYTDISGRYSESKKEHYVRIRTTDCKQFAVTLPK